MDIWRNGLLSSKKSQNFYFLSKNFSIVIFYLQQTDRVLELYYNTSY